jgi:hypothetical protein
VKIDKLVAMALIVGVPALGCGDDTEPGGEGSGSGSEGSTGAGSSTTVVAEESSSGAGSGSAEGSSSSGGESSSSGEPPPTEVTAEGEVVDFVNMGNPIADAAITVFDVPGVTATSDAEGLFSIGPLAPDTPAIFVVAPNTDYWGAVIPTAIGSDPLQEDVQLSQIPSAFVDLQIMILQQDQTPAMPNLDQAIVIVRLLNNTAVMEGPTTIDMQPAPAPDTFYAPDAEGAPILNQNTIEFSALPVVVFFNVPDFDPGALTIDATHPTRECTVLFPETPTIGQHITLIDIECVPA